MDKAQEEEEDSSHMEQWEEQIEHLLSIIVHWNSGIHAAKEHTINTFGLMLLSLGMISSVCKLNDYFCLLHCT